FERRKKISNVGKIVKDSRFTVSTDIDEIEKRKKTFYKTDEQGLSKTWPEYAKDSLSSDDEECPEECKNYLEMFNKIKKQMDEKIEDNGLNNDLAVPENQSFFLNNCEDEELDEKEKRRRILGCKPRKEFCEDSDSD
ncbi:hypothetical protein L6269_02630, partial [Candidatus Dependentiae bacterium]|nr:hypothetical protein [Candidatus Dependentiae bacterium]